MGASRVMVTGNLGYIGSVLTERLINIGYSVIGYDCGYFMDCYFEKPKSSVDQILKDIRDVDVTDFEAIDSVIYLAGLSNDPLGELSPGLTEEINHYGAVNFAAIAKRAGVKRFIYASSQSMYGVSAVDEELDEYLSQKNPITSYAKTKWQAELDLEGMNDTNFSVCAFRPSTVFGASPRLRCDIVFNNLIACAYTTGLIEIKSDGSPWRPVVHIQDVCTAFIAGISAPAHLISGRAFNVGVPNGNYSVRQLALAAQKSVPESKLIFTGEHGSDSRTYKVSFKRILDELKGFYKPMWSLEQGAKELIDHFKAINFTEESFRGNKVTRLLKINTLLKENSINSKLRRGS